MIKKPQKFTFSTIIVFILPMLVAVFIAMWIYMTKFIEVEMSFYLQAITNNFMRIERMESEGAPYEAIASELTMGDLKSGGCVAVYSTDSIIYGNSWNIYDQEMKVLGRVRHYKDKYGMEKSWCYVRAKDKHIYYSLSVVDCTRDRIYRLIIDTRDFLDTYILIGWYLVIATLSSVILSLVIYALYIVPKIRRLRDSETRMGAELAIAHDVQMGLVRQNDNHYSDDQVEVYGIVRPAREVGGDFFYYVRQDERFWFCVGDVSDKGAGAAILMAILMSRLRVSVELIKDLISVNKWLNRAVIEDGNGMFCTMLIGYIEGDTVTFINSGHCPPFIVSYDDASAVKEVRKVQMTPNIPIGVIEDYDFQVNSVTLNRNESLFLYTDGITDAVNNAHEMFGEKHLCDSLSRGSDILAEVEKWRAGVASWDDETELIIKRKA